MFGTMLIAKMWVLTAEAIRNSGQEAGFWRSLPSSDPVRASC